MPPSRLDKQRAGPYIRCPCRPALVLQSALTYFGPLPVTPKGNSYVLLFTDRFRRRGDMYAVSAAEFTAEGTADILDNNKYIPLWRCPDSLQLSRNVGDIPVIETTTTKLSQQLAYAEREPSLPPPTRRRTTARPLRPSRPQGLWRPGSASDRQDRPRRDAPQAVLQAHPGRALARPRPEPSWRPSPRTLRSTRPAP